MRYVGLFLCLIAVVAFVGCGDEDPVSSAPEEEIAALAGKLTISATKAGGYRGSFTMKTMHGAAMEAFNDHDLDRQQSYYAEDILFESLGAPPPANGKAEFRPWMEAFYVAFPDVQAKVLNQKTSGNLLVSEEIYTGTHLGDFGGIPPTGQVVQAPVLNVVEYEGDKIKHQTHYWDMASLMMQMGILPAGELPPLVPSFELPDPAPTGLSPLEADAEMFAAFNTHNLFEWSKKFHQDAVVRYGSLGMMPMTREQYIALHELNLTGFPDVILEVTREVDLGEGWVLSEFVSTGTQTGPYFGVPASGKVVLTRWGMLTQFDVEGLVRKSNIYFNNLDILMQIGAIPAP